MNVNIPPHPPPPHPACAYNQLLLQVHMNVNIPPHPPTPSYVVPGPGTSLYIHIHACMHTYIHTYIHTSIYIYILHLVYITFSVYTSYILYILHHIYRMYRFWLSTARCRSTGRRSFRGRAPSPTRRARCGDGRDGCHWKSKHSCH